MYFVNSLIIILYINNVAKRKNNCNVSKWNYETDFVVVGMGTTDAVVTSMLADANFCVIDIEASGYLTTSCSTLLTF